MESVLVFKSTDASVSFELLLPLRDGPGTGSVSLRAPRGESEGCEEREKRSGNLSRERRVGCRCCCCRVSGEEERGDNGFGEEEERVMWSATGMILDQGLV